MKLKVSYVLLKSPIVGKPCIYIFVFLGGEGLGVGVESVALHIFSQSCHQTDPSFETLIEVVCFLLVQYGGISSPLVFPSVQLTFKYEAESVWSPLIIFRVVVCPPLTKVVEFPPSLPPPHYSDNIESNYIIRTSRLSGLGGNGA